MSTAVKGIGNIMCDVRTLVRMVVGFSCRIDLDRCTNTKPNNVTARGSCADETLFSAAVRSAVAFCG